MQHIPITLNVTENQNQFTGLHTINNKNLKTKSYSQTSVHHFILSLHCFRNVSTAKRAPFTALTFHKTNKRQKDNRSVYS